MPCNDGGMGRLGHRVVYHDAAKWAAVLANNGGCGPSWQWGDELLVGFTVGEHSGAPGGHQCDSAGVFVVLAGSQHRRRPVVEIVAGGALRRGKQEGQPAPRPGRF